jgi:hypothetical protein
MQIGSKIVAISALAAALLSTCSIPQAFADSYCNRSCGHTIKRVSHVTRRRHIARRIMATRTIVQPVVVERVVNQPVVVERTIDRPVVVEKVVTQRVVEPVPVAVHPYRRGIIPSVYRFIFGG